MGAASGPDRTEASVPAPNDRLRHSWQANAGVWTEAVRSRTLESRRLVTDDAIVDVVLRRTEGRVLDVGCGEGWLARRLATAGREVLGFDASEPLIVAARAATSDNAAAPHPPSAGAGAAGARSPRYEVLSYEDFAQDPAAVGADWGVAVCNFSLLAEWLQPMLIALRTVIRPHGHLVVQTLHPVVASGAAGYADGWREETFDGLAGAWEPMPWYYRTFGTWVDELHEAGWQLRRCTEPVHPTTGAPASLILHATAHIA